MQNRPVPVKERMIHLFGIMTPSNKALAGENDNVFEKKALQATGNAEIGMVYEADDSGENDR